MVRVGSQRPRIELVPESVYSAGVEAVELSRVCGMRLDDWQQHVLAGALGVREDGKWSAGQVGLVLPRQLGKSVVLEARMLAGLSCSGSGCSCSAATNSKQPRKFFGAS